MRIITANNLDPHEFEINYLHESQPLVIKGEASQWPSKWSIEYLLDLYGDKKVTVIVSDKELFDYSNLNSTVQRQMTFHEASSGIYPGRVPDFLTYISEKTTFPAVHISFNFAENKAL